MTFDIEGDLGSSTLLQKWILEVKIIWKTGITFFLCILVQSYIFICFRYANYLLIGYYANKKKVSQDCRRGNQAYFFFSVPTESGSIIKPCTLNHF